jgi:hypothetical protein
MEVGLQATWTSTGDIGSVKDVEDKDPQKSSDKM